MKKRFKLYDVLPAAVRPLAELDKLAQNSGIEPSLLELIKIKASQINGCAYCLNMHNTDAVKRGEKPARLYVLSAWREALDWFSEEEQVVLQLTEQITLISLHGLSDEVYEKAITLFGEEKTAHLIVAIITINAWNRVGVGLQMHPM